MKPKLLLSLILLMSVELFSQTNKSIQYQVDIEELRTKIIKLDKEITEFEDRLELLNDIQTVYLNNNDIDSIKLQVEIDRIKTYAKGDEDKILKTYRIINRIQFKCMSSVSNILYNYSENANTNSTEITFLRSRYSNLGYYMGSFISYNNQTNKETIDFEEFNKYKEELSYEKTLEEIKSQISKLGKDIDSQIAKLNTKITNHKNEISALRKERIEKQSLIQEKSEYDKTIFQWGFPVFILFILLLYLLPLWFHYKRQRQDSTVIDSLYKLIYGSGLLTEIITVFLLTSTILLLGITDKLEPEILGTLIGGISGYVLGRSFKGNNKD